MPNGACQGEVRTGLRAGAHGLVIEDMDEVLRGFEGYLRTATKRVREERTIKDHVAHVRRFLKWARGRGPITRELILTYLAERYGDKAPRTRANQIKSLRRFFRDYLARPDLMAGIELPSTPRGEASWPLLSEEDGRCPSDEEVRAIIEAMPNLAWKTLAMAYAKTGARCSELLAVRVRDIDFEHKVIRLRHNTSTKRAGVALFDDELAELLRAYIRQAGLKPEDRLWPFTRSGVYTKFRRISKRLFGPDGPIISPQDLRIWHAWKLAQAGVPDRYVDVLQGRAPKSVIAQYYTPRGLRELRAIYEKADLTILRAKADYGRYAHYLAEPGARADLTG